jgi:hypothetical protein
MVVTISFIISFSIFYSSLYFYHLGNHIDPITGVSNIQNVEKNFYEQNFDTHEKKIFILGSSQVRSLNTIYIHDILKENDYNYTVYNLAKNVDVPLNRLQTIDLIVQAKPDIVVYGISSRDFVTSESQDGFGINSNSSLPNPHDLFSGLVDSMNNHFKIDSSFLKSPEIDLLGFFGTPVQQLMKPDNPIPSPFPNLPFTQVYKSYFQVSNYTDSGLLQTDFSSGIEPLNTNINLKAFEKIITTLHSHNIHVIVFVTPKERYYINNMPREQVDQWNTILNNLSVNYHLHIYSLWDKYADLPIWNDATHVTFQNSGMKIYSNDVAKIILQEIES